MKNNLKILENLNFKKLSKFQIIFIVYIIVFSVFLILSIPGLFNFEKYHTQIIKEIEKEFKFKIENISNIKYRFVPEPHLVVEQMEIGFVGYEDSNFATLKDTKIYTSLFKLYNLKLISIKKININKANFNFNKEKLELFVNHFQYKITKPIEIKKSNFFFLDQKKEVVLISPINNLNYYINYETKEKLFKANGKLFDVDYNLKWTKNYSTPNKADFVINFKNPNIMFKNKIFYGIDKIGSLSINALNNILKINYNKKSDKLVFSSNKDTRNNFYVDGKINFDPFDFNIGINIKDKNINFIFNPIYQYLFEYKDKIHSNLNGNLNIKLENIKSNFFKDFELDLSFKGSNIEVEKNQINLKKIGYLNLKNFELTEIDNSFFISSDIFLNVKSQKNFYKKFSIPLKDRIDLSLIYFRIEKDLEKNDFYISNVSLNKKIDLDNDSALIIKTKTKVKNINELRRYMQKVFTEFN